MQKETVVTIAKPASNIISLKELADDTWLWEKSQKDYTKTLKKCKIKKIKKKKILAKEKMFQIIEAEIPKSVEERIEEILKEIKKKKMEFVEEYQIDKPIRFKNYCISDSDLDYYDNIHFVEA